MLAELFGIVWIGVAVMMLALYIYQMLARNICLVFIAASLLSLSLFVCGVRLWIQCAAFLVFLFFAALFPRFSKKSNAPAHPPGLADGRFAIALTDMDRNSFGVVKRRNDVFMAKAYDASAIRVGQPVRIVSLADSVAGVVSA